MQLSISAVLRENKIFSQSTSTFTMENPFEPPQRKIKADYVGSPYILKIEYLYCADQFENSQFARANFGDLSF